MRYDDKTKAAVLRHLKTKNPGTYKEISDKFGVSTATVARWASEENIQKPDGRANRPSRTAARDKEIRAARKGKNPPTYEEIAAQFGLSRQRVHAICNY